MAIEYQVFDKRSTLHFAVTYMYVVAGLIVIQLIYQYVIFISDDAAAFTYYQLKKTHLYTIQQCIAAVCCQIRKWLLLFYQRHWAYQYPLITTSQDVN